MKVGPINGAAVMTVVMLMTMSMMAFMAVIMLAMAMALMVTLMKHKRMVYLSNLSVVVNTTTERWC